MADQKKDEKPTGDEKKIDAEKESVEVPKKYQSLVESIEKLTVLELSELVKILEDKLGVSAAAPMAVAVAPGAAASGAEGGAAGGEEKSEVDIELTEVGDQKIAVIKALKQITGAGLTEAKTMTEEAPKVIKEKVAKKEAEEIKKTLEEAGAKVTFK